MAITDSHSPLVREADAALVVDHVEYVSTQVPKASRILQLLVIDILAVGVRVAMRLGERGVNVLPQEATKGQGEDRPEPPAPPPSLVRRTGPGISAARPLARLTSHSR